MFSDPWVWGWKIEPDASQQLGLESPDFIRRAPTPNLGLTWILYRCRTSRCGYWRPVGCVSSDILRRVGIELRWNTDNH
jgi:hypothetical protein